jgi:hypothetical protein
MSAIAKKNTEAKASEPGAPQTPVSSASCPTTEVRSRMSAPTSKSNEKCLDPTLAWLDWAMAQEVEVPEEELLLDECDVDDEPVFDDDDIEITVRRDVH